MDRMWLRRKSWRGVGFAGLFGFALTGCALLPQPDVHPPTAQVPRVTAEAPPNAVRYDIHDTELTIHIYRAGWLSSKAHNHVMTSSTVDGFIHLTRSIESSTAVLYFRPWDLVLDAPESRAAAGAGFESVRTPEDIAATRTRMLGPNGFDANKFPFVVATVGWLDDTRVTLTLDIRGEEFNFEVPASWSIKPGEIHVSADFELDHRALGLKPYSAFLGAIAVAQPIRVQLDLTARRSDPV